MKKLAILVLSVFILVLCSCQQNTAVSSSSDVDDMSSVTEISSAASSEETQIAKYQGKQSYELSHYLGEFYQDKEYYYYADDCGIFNVNKNSGEHKQLDGQPLAAIEVFDDTIYVEGNQGSVFVYDKQTQKFTEKSFKELFFLNLDPPNTRYMYSVLMVKDGWLVWIKDDRYDTSIVYLTDRDFTTKEMLPIPKMSFVLDDDVFFLQDGIICCYNLASEKTYYVTDQIDDVEYISYLEDTYIIAEKTDKISIINLATSEIVKELENVEGKEKYILCDDEILYICTSTHDSETASGTCQIDAVPIYEDKSERIYEDSYELPYFSLGLSGIDEQYVYLRKWGHENDDGTPSTHCLRINKDGSGKTVVFNHKGYN